MSNVKSASVGQSDLDWLGNNGSDGGDSGEANESEVQMDQNNPAQPLKTGLKAGSRNCW